jgi:YebC/PmpR family DNA-binding regulatory protein
MARHSHWANIKKKKGAADAIKGKALTLHAKLVEIAARKGGDPSMNPSLRGAIDKAKADNVPNANIERAIRRGTGEDKDAAILSEITYEAFGPSGSVFLIDVITDNTNRSFANLRTITTKNGGNMGAAGAVAWKFDKKAYLLVDAGKKDKDEAELEIIDCGADDLAADGSKFEVYGNPEKLGELRDSLTRAGFKVEKDELIWAAKEDMKVTDLETAKKIISLIDLIEEDEDVSKVSSNVDFDESILAQL